MRMTEVEIRQAIARGADALEEEVHRRNEWYGLDNWSYYEVAEFVLGQALGLNIGEGVEA